MKMVVIFLLFCCPLALAKKTKPTDVMLVKHHLGKPRHIESADLVLYKKPDTNTRVYAFWRGTVGKKVRKFAAKDNWEICHQRRGNAVHMMDKDIEKFVIANLPITVPKTPSSPVIAWDEAYWIGLIQISEVDQSRWEWTGFERLEGGINSKLWYDPKTPAREEPDSLDDKCVVIGSLDAVVGAHTTRVRGYLNDQDCYEKNNAMCQFEFGNGFLSLRTAVIWKKTVDIYCIGFGDPPNYEIEWQFSGDSLTTDKTKFAYQHDPPSTKGKGKYMEKILTINGHKKPEPGFYFQCVISENVVTKGTPPLLTNTETAVLDFRVAPYVEVTASVKSYTFQNQEKIYCNATGLPPPIIEWAMLGNLEGGKHPMYEIIDHFGITYWTAGSEFVIRSPFLFGAKSTLMCGAQNSGFAEADIKINEDMIRVDESTVAIPFGGMSRTDCLNIGGDYVRKKSEIWCQFTAFSGFTRNTIEPHCHGSDILFHFTDRTHTTANYSVRTSSRGRSFISDDNPYEGSNQLVRVTGLLPRTEYNIHLEFKPQHWEKSITNDVTYFTFGEAPGKIRHIRAGMTYLGNCHVTFTLPVDQSQPVQAQVHETRYWGWKIEEAFEVYELKYSDSSFTIVNESLLIDKRMKVRLVSCGGEVGEESKSFTCKKFGRQFWFLYGISAAIAILITIFIFEEWSGRDVWMYGIEKHRRYRFHERFVRFMKDHVVETKEQQRQNEQEDKKQNPEKYKNKPEYSIN